MASSNTCTFPSEKFQMPSEPRPLPSLESDEESFVVLGKSMSPDYDDMPTSVENEEPIGASVIEEAKQLISKELSQMEELSLSKKSSLQTDETDLKETTNVKSEQSGTEKSHPTLQMDQSTVLPKMPQVDKGFDSSNTISITTFSTDWTSEEVQKKISQIIEENIHLKDTILQNNMSMKSQYERIVAWQEDVQRVHQAHKDKMIEAKEYIEKLKKENYNLTRDLEMLREMKTLRNEELASKTKLKEKENLNIEKLIKTTDDNLKQFELDVANKKVKELELALNNMTVENNSLKEENNKLTHDIAKISEYEKDVEKLHGELDFSKLQIEKLKMELVELNTQNEEKQISLNEVVESLRSQLMYAQQQRTMLSSPEEVNNIRQQLANTQIMLTQVEHSRTAAYAQVDALSKEVLEVRNTVLQYKHQKDEIYALQTQLDLYKADFEAERNAKDMFKNENGKLLEDMQNLQRRNQQLQEEIDMTRERDFVMYPPINRQRTRDTGSSSSSSTNEHSHKCPKCNFGFTTLNALENHVYRCIELDDHLP